MALRVLGAGKRVAALGARRPVLATCRPFSGQNQGATFATEQSNVKDAFKYCREQVQRFDHDNYLWVLKLPKDTQAATLCLRAFNVETALVADASKESQIQQMRMLWWREAVKAIFSSTEATPKHPVVQALEFVASARPLSRYWLQRVITAREEDLVETGPPNTLADLEAYAESTQSALLYLQLEAAGIKDKNADHAASHLGKAVGLATLLRGMPHHAQARRCYYPVELLAKHKFSQEDLYAGKSSDALKDATLSIAGAAKAHLDEARALCAAMPAEARPLMLGAIPCRLFLDALQAADFDVFDPALHKRGGVSPLKLQLEIQWASMRGTY